MVKDARRYVAMSEERKAAFLVALRRSGGNFTFAAQAASPHSQASARSKPGFTSFRALMDRDAEFAAQVQEVLEQVRDDVFAMIWKLAMEGTKDNVYQKGEQIFNRDGSVAQVQKYDSKLLLRLAAKLDPENWSETKNVNHSVVHSGAAVMLKPSDLQALSADQTAHLQDILITIQSSRKGASSGEQTKALTHQPGETLDVDFEEIEEITDAELAEAIPY